MECKPANLSLILSSRELDKFTVHDKHLLMQYEKFYLSKVPMSLLFPALGSAQNVVILGFIRNADIIVSIDDIGVQFHSYLFSRHAFKISGLRLKLLLMNDQSPLHGLLKIILVDTLSYMAIIYFSNFESQDTPNSGISSNLFLRLYYNGKEIYMDSNMQDSNFNRSIGYNYLNGALFLINNKETIYMYYIRENSEANNRTCLQIEDEYHSSSTSPYLIIGNSCQEKWFWSSSCSPCNCNYCNLHTIPNEIPIPMEDIHILRSKIDSELLIQEIFKKFYPQINICTQLKDYEIRIIGPSERHSQILLLAGVSIFYNGMTKYLAFTLSLHPWIGRLNILRFIDLAAFITNINKMNSYNNSNSNNTDCNNSDSNSNKNNNIPFIFNNSIHISWLSAVVDYYVRYLQASDIVIQSYEDTIEMLSNSCLINSGESLRTIRHPTLPMEIYHDEDSYSSLSEEFNI